MESWESLIYSQSVRNTDNKLGLLGQPESEEGILQACNAELVGWRQSPQSLELMSCIGSGGNDDCGRLRSWSVKLEALIGECQICKV